MKNLIFLSSFVLLFSCGNNDGGFYSTLNDSKSSAIKMQLENYLSKNYEPMGLFIMIALCFLFQALMTRYTTPMFLRALNFIILFFQTSIFPCKMGIYMWKPLTMGRRFGQRLTLLGMRKEGFLNKRFKHCSYCIQMGADRVIEEHHYSDRTAFENEISLYSEINKK